MMIVTINGSNCSMFSSKNTVGHSSYIHTIIRNTYKGFPLQFSPSWNFTPHSATNFALPALVARSNCTLNCHVLHMSIFCFLKFSDPLNHLCISLYTHYNWHFATLSLKSPVRHAVCFCFSYTRLYLLLTITPKVFGPYLHTISKIACRLLSSLKKHSIN